MLEGNRDAQSGRLDVTKAGNGNGKTIKSLIKLWSEYYRIK